MSGKECFDVLIIVPLEEELHEVMEVFPGLENRSTETTFRYTVDCGNPDLRVLVVNQEGMGKSHAARVVKDCLAEFNIGTIACIGIAGSLTNDLRLCDVCYTGDLIDVTDNSKVEDIENGMDVTLSPSYYDTPREFTASINFSRLFPELRATYKAWQDSCESFAKSVISEPVLERDGKKKPLGLPKSMNGMIACGNVTKSALYNDKIRGVQRKVLAIETESGGIFDDAKRAGVPCVTVRGISDHADRHKGILEDETGQKVRKIAAANAASFFRMQLNNTHFLKVMRRSQEDRQLPFPFDQRKDADKQSGLAVTIAEITDAIDARLRELSPEYRLQVKGYRLPVPRIRKAKQVTGLSQNYQPAPTEVRQALNSEDVVLISLARNYPDLSLPWVIASDLLTAEIDGKQAIPVVVNANVIRPPKGTLEKASDFDISTAGEDSNTQLVYIINELPLESPTRLKYLIAQVKANPDKKFVIVTRSDANFVAQSEFSSSVGANLYNLIEVSFVEIAHFVQKNFEIAAVEAEVIALRLQNTFRHFDLSAHPTYFAGINKEVLTALLQANRRAELIQLAVDGFLTFVVAGDKAKVKLSRTTRERFLRSIAAELHIEKRTFRHAELVDFARSFANEKDFEIDPIEFVSSFVESGILHFDNDAVCFSLPFVESYLLAAELVGAPEKAKSYFGMTHGYFDIGAFDLYAELGASEEIVSSVINEITTSIEDFALEEGEVHVLLRETLLPSSLSSVERIHALESSLQRTIEDVHTGRGDTQRKQKILDVADRVREAAVDESGFGIHETEEEISDDDLKIERAVKSWAVGTTLLGSGAEDLNANVKQELASKLIRLGSIIIHNWTSAYADVDFVQMKKDLTSDKALKELEEDANGDRLDLKRKVEGVVDVLEFSFLGEPTRQVLGHLCEGARQKVLASSLVQIKPSGLMDELIHGVWLSDIDSERGDKVLSPSLKRLPAATFLRIVLSAHFLSRVYWNHGRKEDRLKLLDQAAEIIKPLGKFDKGRIQRMVKNEET